MAVFSAVDNISSVMATIGGNAETLHSRVTRLGQSMTAMGNQLTMGLTVPLAGLGAGIAKFSMDYETSMTVAQTMTGSTAEQFDLYKEKVIELTRVLPQNADTLAKALYFIASAGYRGQEALDILTASGKAATNALAEIETVAQSVTAVIASYGLEGKDASPIRNGRDRQLWAGGQGRGMDH